MSGKLHLGVFDIPYVDVKDKTTGDVANILEAKYHPMEIFYQLHEEEIAQDIAHGFQGALETLLMGGPLNLANTMHASTSRIDERFKDFLTNKEMEGLGYPGVPTKAALEGVSHRFKKKRGSRRPSFVDTGQYQASFHSWMELVG
jgi:hypothetical protein